MNVSVSNEGSPARHREIPSHPSSINASYIRDTQNLQPHYSQLTETRGNRINDEGSSVLRLLFESISRGNTNDSVDLSPILRCHKNTRLAVIHDIISWVSDVDRTCRLLWLEGISGVGKSAIVQTIAERCAVSEQLAATFFFSGASEDRKTAHHFFFKLAYQLSSVIPAVRVEIEREIKADPHILSKPCGHQLERLILRPLSWLTDLPPMVIIVDGLDECDLPGQASILELVPTLVADLPRSFCLLIASRPETHIKGAFGGSLQHLFRRVTLDERYKPDEDIEIFLQSKLSQLFKRQVSHERAWPLHGDIQLLVRACSGQFICAVTIVRYIEDGPRHPDVMLKNLLNTTGARDTALAPIDSLYSRILDTCPDSSCLLSILGFVLVSSCHVGFIEGLLGLDPGGATQCLGALYSLLHIYQKGENLQIIRIRHPSFREFLLDPSRSGCYFIDPAVRHAQVAACMLNMHTRRNVDESLLATSMNHWGLHCTQAVLTDELLKALQDFDLQSWLANSSQNIFLYDTSVLVDVMGWMSKANHPSLNTVHAAWRKVSYNVFHAKISNRRPPDLATSTYLALTVIALMAKYLGLDTSVVCDILGPFVTESKTLWFTLDSRIGIASPFEPSSEEYHKTAERLYHHTLQHSRSNNRSLIRPDARILKAPVNTGFNLKGLDTLGRFKLNSAKCHTHFALACLAYVSSVDSHPNSDKDSQPHACEVRADYYATHNWAYHVTKSLPTPAVMVNLQDFIHTQHSRECGDDKLGLVIGWLKNLTNPPLELISCWESASHKANCEHISHNRAMGVSNTQPSYHRPPRARSLPLMSSISTSGVTEESWPPYWFRYQFEHPESSPKEETEFGCDVELISRKVHSEETSPSQRDKAEVSLDNSISGSGGGFLDLDARKKQPVDLNSTDAKQIGVNDRPDGIEDGTNIVAKLQSIFKDINQYKVFLKCDRSTSQAQALLDLFQQLLQNASLEPQFRHNLVVAIQRLARITHLYPTCFTLEDVELIHDRPVAAGGFADIHQGRIKDKNVCLKVIRLYQISQVDHVLKTFYREAILWGHLSHPNLLPFYGLFRFQNRLCFVSPWAENGDINNYLQLHPQANRVLLALDVAVGISYLHANEIVHGDLKGPNILVNDSGRAQLTDFGLSGVTDSNVLRWTSHSSAASKGGSTRWQAPELFDPDGDEFIPNSKASDIYGWACICYEIFTGSIPFHELARESTVISKVRGGARPSRPSAMAPAWVEWGLTEAIWSLQEDCWNGDPMQRPSANAIVTNLSSTVVEDPRPIGGWEAFSPAQSQDAVKPQYLSIADLEEMLWGLSTSNDSV